MRDSIDTITRRTQRYWYVDGLAEIAIGLFFMLLSAYFPLQERIVTASPYAWLANLGLFAAVLLIVWLFRHTLQAVKTRLTYPRTGFVAYPWTQGRSRWLRYGLAACYGLVGVSLVALASRSQTIHTWVPLLTGTIAGLTVLYLSYRFRLMRLAFLACALILTGIVVSLFIPNEMLAAALSSFVNGVCFFVSGMVTLVRYLRKTQPHGEVGL